MATIKEIEKNANKLAQDARFDCEKTFNKLFYYVERLAELVRNLAHEIAEKEGK